jgi:hypothetical protein
MANAVVAAAKARATGGASLLRRRPPSPLPKLVGGNRRTRGKSGKKTRGAI